MQVRHVTIVLAVLLLGAALTAQTAPPAPAKAPDITGQWTSSFDTQIGTQSYTYDFVVKDGKVDGVKVTFGETFSFQGMEIKITYVGTITSADEIKFTRNVAEFATEELVAKRVKK